MLNLKHSLVLISSVICSLSSFLSNDHHIFELILLNIVDVFVHLLIWHNNIETYKGTTFATVRDILGYVGTGFYNSTPSVKCNNLL